MQEHIRELEQNLARGDIASASKTIAQIYDCRNALDGAAEKDLMTLEAIYFSLVHLAIRPRPDLSSVAQFALNRPQT